MRWVVQKKYGRVNGSIPEHSKMNRYFIAKLKAMDSEGQCFLLYCICEEAILKWAFYQMAVIWVYLVIKSRIQAVLWWSYLSSCISMTSTCWYEYMNDMLKNMNAPFAVQIFHLSLKHPLRRKKVPHFKEITINGEANLQGFELYKCPNVVRYTT